ncbi:hypothetical protein V492_02659 [Pseudogymnoascus sp. VKM F-4246]|nr:hypothetical protein V492_02659 [Pseudogymnoascus sp. VKM F-4246]
MYLPVILAQPRNVKNCAAAAAATAAPDPSSPPNRRCLNRSFPLLSQPQPPHPESDITMRGFMAPLGYGLIVASFMVNQIHLATAACTNTTTYVVNSLSNPVWDYDHYAPFSGKFGVKLDFISCPSSGNVSCTFPVRDYTFTVAPQFNISLTNSSYKDPNGNYIDDMIYASQAFDLPLNSSDRESINGYMQKIWKTPGADFPWHLLLSPLTMTVSSKNISSSVNLTVEPGYSMTLTYNSFRASSWVYYTQCDNKSLDGKLIGAIMPYYDTGPAGTTNETLAGRFVVNKQFLNDTVPEDSSGIGSGARRGRATMLVVFGVLAFNWL